MLDTFKVPLRDLDGATVGDAYITAHSDLIRIEIEPTGDRKQRILQKFEAGDVALQVQRTAIGRPGEAVQLSPITSAQIILAPQSL